MGCPTLGEITERVILQRFEHGWMLWQARRDTAPPTIYVLFDGSQKYLRFDDTYTPGVDPLGTSDTPPGGLVAPVGGFGKIWREAGALSVRDRLGWATMAESSGDGAVETFQHGLMVYTPNPREIFVLVQARPIVPRRWRRCGEHMSIHSLTSAVLGAVFVGALVIAPGFSPRATRHLPSVPHATRLRGRTAGGANRFHCRRSRQRTHQSTVHGA